MKSRTWPYGTEKKVRVINKERLANGLLLILVETDPPKEGHVCIYDDQHLEAKAAQPNEKGIITFTKGGPTGGYWDYRSALTINWRPRQPGFNLTASSLSAAHYDTVNPSQGWVLYSRRGDGVWETRTEREFPPQPGYEPRKINGVWKWVQVQHAGYSTCPICNREWLVTPGDDCLMPACGCYGLDATVGNPNRPCEECGTAHAMMCQKKA